MNVAAPRVDLTDDGPGSLRALLGYNWCSLRCAALVAAIRAVAAVYLNQPPDPKSQPLWSLAPRTQNLVK